MSFDIVLEKLASDIVPTNIRYLFYMVTPNETLYTKIEDIPNYFLEPGAAWMFLLVVCEYLITDVMLGKKKYAFNDAITSMNIGLLFLPHQQYTVSHREIFILLPFHFRSGGRFLAASFYPMVYNRLHVIDLPDNSAFTWLLCLFTQDFVFYVGHRAIHEAGVFWSFHQTHHSSEYYNFTTGVRMVAIQPKLDVILLNPNQLRTLRMTFFDLLQAVAIPPNVFIVHRTMVIVFQFWLHASVRLIRITRTKYAKAILIVNLQCIPPLGPLEYIICTPSSHRVHHGRNPYCIDRNYGGVFIIWDRLFGTYAAERMDEEIAFGLVTPVKSFNVLWCEFFEFKAMGYDKGQMRNEKNEEVFPGLWNKVKAALWPPAYLPGMKTKPFFLWLCLKDHTDGVPETPFTDL
ncbi:fatty acid hydroxylase family protein [Cooperia oncophora]